MENKVGGDVGQRGPTGGGGLGDSLLDCRGVENGTIRGSRRFSVPYPGTDFEW